MDVVYGLIPMMLFFGFLVVVVFIWMAKKGQFDDLDGAAHSIFLIDEESPESEQKPTPSASEGSANGSSKKQNETAEKVSEKL